MSNPTRGQSPEWLEAFRSVVTEYHKHRRPDPFMEWFREQLSTGKVEDTFSRVLVTLVDARFDQAGIKAQYALRNTIAVFSARLLQRTSIELYEVPALEVPPLKRDHSGNPMSTREWTERFYGARKVLVQKAEQISNKKTWSAKGLLNFLLEDPKPLDLGVKTSRLAIRWLHELVPELTIDMSDSEVPVDRNLYRVAARLGIINPGPDKYFGQGSPADIIVQAFAKEVFPDNPSLIDEPMWVEARSTADGGHCHSRPNCVGCIFKEICPRNYSTADPIRVGYVA